MMFKIHLKNGQEWETTSSGVAIKPYYHTVYDESSVLSPSKAILGETYRFTKTSSGSRYETFSPPDEIMGSAVLSYDVMPTYNGVQIQRGDVLRYNWASTLTNGYALQSDITASSTTLYKASVVSGMVFTAVLEDSDHALVTISQLRTTQFSARLVNTAIGQSFIRCICSNSSEDFVFSSPRIGTTTSVLSGKIRRALSTGNFSNESTVSSYAYIYLG